MKQGYTSYTNDQNKKINFKFYNDTDFQFFRVKQICKIIL